MNKIIVVDNGCLMFKSIFTWQRNKSVSVKYMYINSLVATLKRLNITPDDIVIIAVDSSKGSWRKKIDESYKANRKELREAHKDIDWNYMFSIFNHLLENLDKCSPFNVINIDYLEADDIMAFVPKYFKDNEVILITIDSDIDMLSIYPNVRIFSPTSKKYKEVKNPYDIIAKKIIEERSDNLIAPIQNQTDYERRRKIVDLINLPIEIENKIQERLSELDLNKDYNIQLLTHRNKFLEIYNKPIKIDEKRQEKKLQKVLK